MPITEGNIKVLRAVSRARLHADRAVSSGDRYLDLWLEDEWIQAGIARIQAGENFYGNIAPRILAFNRPIPKSWLDSSTGFTGGLQAVIQHLQEPDVSDHLIVWMKKLYLLALQLLNESITLPLDPLKRTASRKEMIMAYIFSGPLDTADELDKKKILDGIDSSVMSPFLGLVSPQIIQSGKTGALQLFRQQIIQYFSTHRIDLTNVPDQIPDSLFFGEADTQFLSPTMLKLYSPDFFQQITETIAIAEKLAPFFASVGAALRGIYDAERLLKTYKELGLAPTSDRAYWVVRSMAIVESYLHASVMAECQRTTAALSSQSNEIYTRAEDSIREAISISWKGPSGPRHACDLIEAMAIFHQKSEEALKIIHLVKVLVISTQQRATFQEAKATASPRFFLPNGSPRPEPLLNFEIYSELDFLERRTVEYYLKQSSELLWNLHVAGDIARYLSLPYDFFSKHAQLFPPGCSTTMSAEYVLAAIKEIRCLIMRVYVTLDSECAGMGRMVEDCLSNIKDGAKKAPQFVSEMLLMALTKLSQIRIYDVPAMEMMKGGEYKPLSVEAQYAKMVKKMEDLEWLTATFEDKLAKRSIHYAGKSDTALSELTELQNVLLFMKTKRDILNRWFTEGVSFISKTTPVTIPFVFSH